MVRVVMRCDRREESESTSERREGNDAKRQLRWQAGPEGEQFRSGWQDWGNRGSGRKGRRVFL